MDCIMKCLLSVRLGRILGKYVILSVWVLSFSDMLCVMETDIVFFFQWLNSPLGLTSITGRLDRANLNHWSLRPS
jgi:hypothetical protein